MRFLLASARKDLRRRLADPLALLLWVGLPVLLAVLIGLLAGNGGEAPTARVLVVDRDGTALTNLLVDTLERGLSGRDLPIEFEQVDLESGRERIGDGDGTALLILPPGFGAALLDEEPTTLTLITNPAESILPSIVAEGLEIASEGAFYAQRIAGEPLRALARNPPQGQDGFDADAVAPLAAEALGRMAAARNLLFPPLFELDFGNAEDVGASASSGLEAGFDLARFILPGMLLMSILFIAQGMSDDLWKEKDEGTLRRAVSAPQPMTVFVGGKLLAGFVLIAVVATVALVAAAVVFDVRLIRIPLAIAWCTYAGTGLLGVFAFVAMLGTSRRTASLITMMILFPLMATGGSFLPFEAMPAWMRAVGVWTPNGAAVRQLHEILFGTPTPGALAAAAAIIAAAGGAALVLCARRSSRFAAS